MAKTLTFVKRSELPVAVKGKVGTCSVMVSNKGQVGLTSLAAKALNGVNHIAMAFMGQDVFLLIPDAPLVTKAKLETKDMIGLNKAKKGGTVSFPGTAVLDKMVEYGADAKYEFRASGNQTFPATWDEKNKALKFTLPAGSLTPKPVTHREKKVKVSAVKAEAGSISGTAVEQTIEDGELSLA